jgi:hypothetical protein
MSLKSHHRCRFPAASRGALLLTLVACSRQEVARQEIVQGECRPMYGADACSFGELAGDSVVAFGATIPVSSIENAPADAPMVWPPEPAAVVPMPQAVTSATGFTELTIVWEAHGHPPGPFLTPHFDFHFYAIPASEREAIDCADLTKAEQLPASYQLPDISIPGIGDLIGVCVPKMGMHALAGAELADTTMFEKTMVVGYYLAHPIFVEPMIAQAKLMQRQSFTLDVPDVPGRPAASRYPMGFRADYDSTAQAYRFVFSNLTAAAAP